MAATLVSKREEDGVLRFTIKDIDVSVVNALRRTILCDIPCVVFKTAPYEANTCDIQKNTTRFNNEIIKHRLSLVPIHLTDLTIPFGNYVLEVAKQNENDQIEFVTTEDFQIRDVNTKKLLSKGDRDAIFPKNELTGDHIDFLRLRPRLHPDGVGEEIALTAKFSVATARENGAYNVSSLCFFTNTIDGVARNDAWDKRKKELQQQEGVDLAFEKKNWELLDGNRHFKKNSFDFKLKTIGVYENSALAKMGAKIMAEKLEQLGQDIDGQEARVKIAESITTIANCYDVKLVEEDYTLGRVLAHFLYKRYYEDEKTLTFCGFKKEHPHLDYALLRVAFKNPSDANVLRQILKNVVATAVEEFRQIEKLF